MLIYRLKDPTRNASKFNSCICKSWVFFKLKRCMLWVCLLLWNNVIKYTNLHEVQYLFDHSIDDILRLWLSTNSLSGRIFAFIVQTGLSAVISFSVFLYYSKALCTDTGIFSYYHFLVLLITQARGIRSWLQFNLNNEKDNRLWYSGKFVWKKNGVKRQER